MTHRKSRMLELGQQLKDIVVKYRGHWGSGEEGRKPYTYNTVIWKIRMFKTSDANPEIDTSHQAV